VQPALYEAFGLTVIEAMTCGLPTFATNKGGECAGKLPSPQDLQVFSVATFLGNRMALSVCLHSTELV
jgi:Glycosyl transferases group 1